MEHTVKKVISNENISILRVCPPVTRMDNEPLIFDFDYFETFPENVSAEVVYYDRTIPV